MIPLLYLSKKELDLAKLAHDKKDGSAYIYLTSKKNAHWKSETKTKRKKINSTRPQNTMQVFHNEKDKWFILTAFF